MIQIRIRDICDCKKIDSFYGKPETRSNPLFGFVILGKSIEPDSFYVENRTYALLIFKRTEQSEDIESHWLVSKHTISFASQDEIW